VPQILEALWVCRLLLAVECNQAAIDEIDDRRFACSWSIVAWNDLRGHRFNFCGLFRREKLKLRRLARCRSAMGVFLSCQNGGPP
jgi:hypothetical protein